MGSFLRENWLWFAGPLLLILVAMGVLIILENLSNGGTSNGGTGEFHYDLF